MEPAATIAGSAPPDWCAQQHSQENEHDRQEEEDTMEQQKER